MELVKKDTGTRNIKMRKPANELVTLRFSQRMTTVGQALPSTGGPLYSYHPKEPIAMFKASSSWSREHVQEVMPRQDSLVLDLAVTTILKVYEVFYLIYRYRTHRYQLLTHLALNPGQISPCSHIEEES